MLKLQYWIILKQMLVRFTFAATFLGDFVDIEVVSMLADTVACAGVTALGALMVQALVHGQVTVVRVRYICSKKVERHCISMYRMYIVWEKALPQFNHA